MKTVLLSFLKSFAGYLVICVSIFLMFRLALLYVHFDDQAGFLALKKDYLHLPIWKTSFYVHVFSSVFCLLAGLTQFSNSLRKQYPNLHRYMGRLYVINILFINFPAGMIMAYYANGLLPSKIAFVILDSLWFYFTLQAWLVIRKGEIRRHKEFMIRSFALTFSAITLRTSNIVLSNYTTLDPLSIYMIDAWLGFVPNLIFAEILIVRLRKTNLEKNLPEKSRSSLL